jgi:hypothetical protein
VSIDSLRYEPGVWLEHRTTSTADPILRGFAGADLLALVDGNTLSTLWGEGGEGGVPRMFREVLLVGSGPGVRVGPAGPDDLGMGAAPRVALLRVRSLSGGEDFHHLRKSIFGLFEYSQL